MKIKGLDVRLYRIVWWIKDKAARLPDAPFELSQDEVVSEPPSDETLKAVNGTVVHPSYNTERPAHESATADESENVPATLSPWWEDDKSRPGLSFSDRLRQLIKPKKPDPIEGGVRIG
jgi:hypothetical protein